MTDLEMQGPAGWTVPEHVRYFRNLLQKDPMAFREEYKQLVRDAYELLVVEATVRREIGERWGITPNMKEQLPALEKDNERSGFYTLLSFMDTWGVCLSSWYMSLGSLFGEKSGGFYYGDI
jgi:hypothetical protein